MPKKKKKPMRRVGRLIQAISAERFNQLIALIGLSQQAAARFMGMNPRTIRDYSAGKSVVEPRTAMLLEIMARYKITPEEALRMIGINVKAAVKAAEASEYPGTAPRFYEASDD
jgi:transcriptional regulator with XRE-family HTH domain